MRSVDSISSGTETSTWESRRCTFMPRVNTANGDVHGNADENGDIIYLSQLLDQAVLQLRKEVPLELVVSMFQKMVRRTSNTHALLYGAHRYLFFALLSRM